MILHTYLYLNIKITYQPPLTFKMCGGFIIICFATFWKKDFKIFAYSEKVCNFALAVSL